MSFDLERPARARLTADQKLQLLARLERSPETAKAIAKDAGISEITLHAWAKAFEAGEDLVDDPVPPPAPEPPPAPALKVSRLPYSDEKKRAAVADYRSSGDSLAVVAARQNVSLSSLQEWATQDGATRPPGVNLRPKREYTDAEKARAVADYPSKGSIEVVAKAHGNHWVREGGKALSPPRATATAAPTKVQPPMAKSVPEEDRVRRRFPNEFRYEVGKRVIDGLATAKEMAELYEVHNSLIYGWVKLIREKKLKPPRQKPGRKPKQPEQPNGHQTEIVEVHRHVPSQPAPAPAPSSQQTALALPGVQMGRITTVQDEVSRLRMENDRLKRLLRKTQDMLLTDASDDD